MKKIKIAFFITNLGQGGAEQQFVNLISGLNKKIFKVDVFLYAYQKEAFYYEIFEYPDITVFKNKLTSRNPVLKILYSILYIRNIIAKNNYDLIYSSLFLNNLLVRIAAGLNKQNKVIISIRTSLQLYTKGLILLEKLFVPCSTIVFNSKKTLNDFKGVFSSRYHRNLHHIYNGIRIPRMQESKYETSSNIIGGFGRQSSHKNFLQLIRAFNNLDTSFKVNSELIIQGARSDASEQIESLIQTLQDNTIVSLLNETTNIDEFFNKISIFVLPSKFEGCPNVLFEALLRNKLCIVSKGANSDNFIIDGLTGLVYDDSDEGLLNAIQQALTIWGNDNCKKIIENGYNYSKENFSIDVMVSNYEKLFLTKYEENQSRNKSKNNPGV
jgi:glycosyltransferase involved in cell wall biosynthesis